MAAAAAPEQVDARRATSAKSKVTQPMPGYGFCGKAMIGTSPMPRSAKNFFRKRAGTPQAMMPSGRSDPKSKSASVTPLPSSKTRTNHFVLCRV